MTSVAVCRIGDAYALRRDFHLPLTVTFWVTRMARQMSLGGRYRPIGGREGAARFYRFIAGFLGDRAISAQFDINEINSVRNPTHAPATTLNASVFSDHLVLYRRLSLASTD